MEDRCYRVKITRETMADHVPTYSCDEAQRAPFRRKRERQDFTFKPITEMPSIEKANNINEDNMDEDPHELDFALGSPKDVFGLQKFSTFLEEDVSGKPNLAPRPRKRALNDLFSRVEGRNNIQRVIRDDEMQSMDDQAQNEYFVVEKRRCLDGKDKSLIPRESFPVISSPKGPSYGNDPFLTPVKNMS